MNTPVTYSWTFRRHLTLLITKYFLRNYITMELEGSPMNGLRVTEITELKRLKLMALSEEILT